MRVWGFARPASLVVLTGILFSPGLIFGPWVDAAVFILAGARIREGFVPYRDFWDHKPPGGYLLNALGQTVLPWIDPWLVSWLMTVVFTAAAILIICSLLGRWLSPAAAWLLSLLCLVGIAWYSVAQGGGLTESFALLPLVTALWAIASRPRTLPAAAGVGVLLSVACLISLQSLAPALALAVVAAIGDQGAWRTWEVARRAFAIVIGGAVLPLAVLGWLLAAGAVGDAFDQLVTYNAAYAKTGTGFIEVLLVVALLLGPLLLLAGVTAVRMVRTPRAFDSVDWSALLWTIGSTLYVGYQGRLLFHYLILAVPPLIFLAAKGMQWLWAAASSGNPNLRTQALALSVVTACLLVMSAYVAGQSLAVTTSDASAAQAGAGGTPAWIRANTPATATLFVWGDDPALYIYSGREPYDRFVYQYPLVTPGYWSTDRTAALLAEWEVSPPQVIVEAPAAVPMFWPRAVGSYGFDLRNLDTLTPLRDYVRGHYRLAASFPDSDVYVYSPATTAPSRSGEPPGGGH
jgi:hypothetical protein